MSLVVEGLTKIYGSQKAVDEVSFSVGEGEILGFLGPNGAGKTTTMKILACYLQQDGGRALVQGHDTREDPLEVRRSIGYLPEHNPLYRDMYVREYLAFVCKAHGLTAISEAIDKTIERTGLQSESGKKIQALSKGYRQRVGLAQALIHDPPVLILDEPTSGLDPNQLVEIRNLVKDLGKTKTVIFSTHILQEVQSICDRVVIINRGKLVADKPIDELVHLHSERQTVRAEFSRAVNIQTLEQVFGTGNVRKTSRAIFEIASSEKQDLRVRVFDFAVKNHLKILEMTSQTTNVEDIFQQLTGNTAN